MLIMVQLSILGQLAVTRSWRIFAGAGHPVSWILDVLGGLGVFTGPEKTDDFFNGGQAKFLCWALPMKEESDANDDKDSQSRGYPNNCSEVDVIYAFVFNGRGQYSRIFVQKSL